MTDQDSRDYEQAAQHADELAIQAELIAALSTSLTRPLTKDEAMLLAWGAGVPTEFYKKGLTA